MLIVNNMPDLLMLKYTNHCIKFILNFNVNRKTLGMKIPQGQYKNKKIKNT